MEMGCSCLLELGPGNALSRMAREEFPDLPARSVADFQSLDGVIDWARRQLEEQKAAAGVSSLPIAPRSAGR